MGAMTVANDPTNAKKKDGMKAEEDYRNSGY
jgi:hypothetical protein